MYDFYEVLTGQKKEYYEILLAMSIFHEPNYQLINP